MKHSVVKPDLRFSLIGPWVDVDPNAPFPNDTTGEATQALRDAGLLPVPVVPGSRVMLTASMTNPPAADDGIASPLYASLVVVERPGAADVQTNSAGDIIPGRRERRLTLNWPDPEVGVVEFHEVTYTVPYPDAPLFVTFTFTTPNLPHIDELEWVFDSIVSTVEWVDPAAEEPSP
jgi:hypothetical protein